jgi:hypothetical protein
MGLSAAKPLWSLCASSAGAIPLLVFLALVVAISLLAFLQQPGSPIGWVEKLHVLAAVFFSARGKLSWREARTRGWAGRHWGAFRPGLTGRASWRQE